MTTSYALDALVAPEQLTWKKSQYGGYHAARGDLMFWGRDRGFADHDACRVSFKASRARQGKGWELRIWTHSLTDCAVVEYDTLAQCKEAATLFAAALAWRFDGTRVTGDSRWSADSTIKYTRGGVEIWVKYPEQRDAWAVKRLAENHVLVAL